MAHIIIKQPDGLYAQYSTISDSFNVWDATKDELIEYVREQAAARAERDCREDIDDADKGRWATLKPSWDVARKNHNKNSDKEDRIKMKPKTPKPCATKVK